MNIEKDVIDYINSVDAVTFAGLIHKFKGKGFEGGSTSYGNQEKNIWFFWNMEKNIADMMKRLVDDGKIIMKPCSRFTYLLDGCDVYLPVAKKDIVHKEPVWQPVAFYKASS